MIEELKSIIESSEFKTMLGNPKMWETLDIDYHPPHVERVWMPWNDGRISLHVIHPCDQEDALLHPHPWESAVFVLPFGGTYEHGIGYKEPTWEPQVVCRQIVENSMYYEMLSPHGVHYVRPINMPVFTIMYSGPAKWKDNTVRVTKELKPLSEEKKLEILSIFKIAFS